MTATTIFSKVLRTGIAINDDDPARYKLVFKATRDEATYYDLSLVPESETDTTRARNIGSWDDANWNGDPDYFYIGNGLYADPDESFYYDSDKDRISDRLLFRADKFKEEAAKVASRDILDNWCWYIVEEWNEEENIVDDIKEEVAEILTPYLIERQDGEPEKAAAKTDAENAESLEDLIKEWREEHGEKWRIKPREKSDYLWFWQNGGYSAWNRFNKDHSAEVIVSATEAEAFFREVAKLPGFFPAPVQDAENPSYYTPFIVSSTGDGEVDGVYYQLEITTQGTETLNTEYADYKSPAVIVEAVPVDEIDFEESWRANHSYQVLLCEDDETMFEYFLCPANGVKAQARTETDAALRSAPDWIKGHIEREKLYESILDVLDSLYSMHLTDFEVDFLPDKYGIDIHAFRRLDFLKKSEIFKAYWEQF